MKTKIFKGNFFEIGQQQGKIYKTNGMNFDKVKIDPVLYKNQLRVYKKYYPQLLEEFRGIADGGKYDTEKLIYYFITSEIIWYTRRLNLERACTIFGVKNKGSLFVGRNYDWYPITEKYFEVYKCINPKSNSFIAITDMEISDSSRAKPQYFVYNVDDAINDKGLFIGLTFAYADQWSYGLSCIHITKLIAETCETVKNALRVFEKVALCCPKNFFIADKNGNMAIVEHTSKKFKVLNPKDNVLIQTNHYIDPELAIKDAVLKHRPLHNTFLRYYETLQKIKFKKNNFQFSDIIKTLGKPGSYVCQNNSANNYHVKTVWTLGLDMTSKKYSIYWDLFGKRKTKELII